MITELHLLRPLWLLALLPLVLILYQRWRDQPGAKVWRGLVDAHLLPHLLAGADGRPRRWPLALLALAWLVGVVALAGPVWERLPQPVFGTAAKRMILLDLSPSMNAADVAPSRLARARFEILDLLAATREGQVALIAFGPDPFIVSPLTGDAQTIADQVPRLATDLLPVPGPRHPERALVLAGELLSQAGATGGEVILVTDGLADGITNGIKAGPSDGAVGGTGLGAPADAAARALAAAGHRVSVLGVGTVQGAPVPSQDGGFAAARGGAIPLARLDRRSLEALARAGQGRYVDLDPGDRDTQALTASGGVSPPGVEVNEQPGLAADQWREEGPWLLLALLPIAALAFRRGWLLPILVLALVLPPGPSWAFGWEDLWQRPDQQGARRLATGDGAAAAERFQDPAWRAAARYKSGDYAGALADLTGLQGPDMEFNRGNALARLGRLDESIAAYERTLAQAPDHADARANLDLIRRLRDQQEQERQAEQDPSASGKQGEQDQQGQQGKGKQPRPADADQPGQDGDPDGGADQPGDQDQDQRATGNAGSAASESGTEVAGTEDSRAPGAAPAGTQNPQDPAGRSASDPAPPQAGDLGSGALDEEPEVTLPKEMAEPGSESSPGQSQRPTNTPTAGTAVTHPANAADLSPQQREQQQALEAQLRRVPDDPAGLLRQRFLLQQLRREGRLP